MAAKNEPRKQLKENEAKERRLKENEAKEKEKERLRREKEAKAGQGKKQPQDPGNLGPLGINFDALNPDYVPSGKKKKIELLLQAVGDLTRRILIHEEEKMATREEQEKALASLREEHARNQGIQVHTVGVLETLKEKENEVAATKEEKNRLKEELDQITRTYEETKSTLSQKELDIERLKDEVTQNQKMRVHEVAEEHKQMSALEDTKQKLVDALTEVTLANEKQANELADLRIKQSEIEEFAAELSTNINIKKIPLRNPPVPAPRFVDSLTSFVLRQLSPT